MESIVKYDSKPLLKNPVFIEALPGIGNVGKIAGDHFATILKAEKFASLYSMNFPPQVIPDENNVIKMASNELWHARTPAGQDIIFIRGDYQGSTPEGQFILAQDIMEILLSYDVSRIITLGGYGTGQMIKEHHVYGAVSKAELKEELSGYGVEFLPGEPKAGIIGAAGLLIGMGQINGIESFCIMGDTSGYFIDHGSSIGLVKVLGKMFGVEELELEGLETEARKLTELTEKATTPEPESKENLSYFG
ncbi:MAG: proteasome assembly chaperone family protein [archaeon]|nr:proteasome assembly chaperone family protein [archaeon]